MLCHLRTQLHSPARFCPYCLLDALSGTSISLGCTATLMISGLNWLLPSARTQRQSICYTAAKVTFSKWKSDLVTLHLPLVTFNGCPLLQDKHQNPCGGCQSPRASGTTPRLLRSSSFPYAVFLPAQRLPPDCTFCLECFSLPTPSGVPLSVSLTTPPDCGSSIRL